jgi:hypothetical protein
VEICDSETPESQYEQLLNILLEKYRTHERIQAFSPLLFTVEMTQSDEHAHVATELLSLLEDSIKTQIFGLRNISDFHEGRR